MSAAAVCHRQHGRPYRIVIGWVDRTARIRQDTKRQHDVLRQGLASAEHCRFAA